jgi:hypothetical protein
MSDTKTNATFGAPAGANPAAPAEPAGAHEARNAGDAAGADGADGADRRRNARLRVLVDEMLASIRESQRRDDWTEEERARAEADLERIMAQVRRAAVDKHR